MSNETHYPTTANEGAALGLDVGTSRLVLASGSATQVKAKAELNAFITVAYSKFTENILKQNKVSYQLNGGATLQLFGNEAARFANAFNTEVRRPMMDGTTAGDGQAGPAGDGEATDGGRWVEVAPDRLDRWVAWRSTPLSASCKQREYLTICPCRSRVYLGVAC